MNKFWVIALDVYKKNIKSVSFVIMILAPFLLMGVMYAAISFSGGFSGPDKIAIVSDDTALAGQLSQVELDDFEFESVSSQKDAEKKLKAGDIEAFLVLDSENEEIKGTLYSESSMGSTTDLTIQQILNGIQSSINAGKLNLTAEQVASLQQPASFEKAKVNFDQDGKMTTGIDNTAVQSAISFVLTIVLWIIIITYASIIAQEIASEKGTRIMEVILSSTRAQTHFYGKLTGVILVAFTQILIYAVGAVVAYNQFKDLDMVKDFLSSFSLDMILGSFLWFTIAFIILGIFVYSVLAALCGSLVSKPEDTPKAVQPIIYLAMIGYFIGLSLGAADPQNIIIKITSYVPMISSFIMPIRLATETASMTEGFISLAVLLAFGILLTLFSAKLYKSNVLVYSEGGMFKSLKQSLSILKNEQKKA